MTYRNHPRKKQNKEIPGIIIQCKSGRFVAYYDHRTDIIANGNNEVEAKENLKELYQLAMEYEKKDEEGKITDLSIPKGFKKKKFVQKIA